jgi:hypothetical protein
VKKAKKAGRVMTGRRVLELQLTRLTKAIRLLREHEQPDLMLPALMILYATIDGLGWLERKDLNGDSTSEDFRSWVDRYFLADEDRSTTLTSEALWFARCALLHAQAAESRGSRKGKVPEIWYRWGDVGIAPLGASTVQSPLNVDPRQLFEIFDRAIERFRAKLAGDSELRRKVEKQALKLWAVLLFPPRITS